MTIKPCDLGHLLDASIAMLLGKEASKAPALLFIQARHQAVDHDMFLSYRAGWTHHTIVTLALMRLALLCLRHPCFSSSPDLFLSRV